MAAGPGAGKSRFLDAVAQAVANPSSNLLTHGDRNPKLREALSAGCIPIRVTFNSFSAILEEEINYYKFSVPKALAYRMLYTYVYLLCA
jgi:hypothetical protein